jgi:hypothetical protein
VQVEDRLHNVTLDITADCTVANVRHGVFVEP